jgi:acetyltransferase-like isoleucine patch superfamily enzyme
MNNKKYAQRLRAIAFCALFPYRLRTKVLRFTGCSVGHGSGIESGSYFGDAVISIGKHVYINTKVIIGNGGEVVIEDYVRIGPGTVIMIYIKKPLLEEVVGLVLELLLVQE